MNIDQKIDADQQKVSDDQTQLDADKTQLANDQAAKAAMQPHIDAWNAVAAYADTVVYEDIKADLIALVQTGLAALAELSS